jgi:hypothetical protein
MERVQVLNSMSDSLTRPVLKQQAARGLPNVVGRQSSLPRHPGGISFISPRVA